MEIQQPSSVGQATALFTGLSEAQVRDTIKRIYPYPPINTNIKSNQALEAISSTGAYKDFNEKNYIEAHRLLQGVITNPWNSVLEIETGKTDPFYHDSGLSDIRDLAQNTLGKVTGAPEVNDPRLSFVKNLLDLKIYQKHQDKNLSYDYMKNLFLTQVENGSTYYQTQAMRQQEAMGKHTSEKMANRPLIDTNVMMKNVNLGKGITVAHPSRKRNIVINATPLFSNNAKRTRLDNLHHRFTAAAQAQDHVSLASLSGATGSSIHESDIVPSTISSMTQSTGPRPKSVSSSDSGLMGKPPKPKLSVKSAGNWEPDPHKPWDTRSNVEHVLPGERLTYELEAKSARHTLADAMKKNLAKAQGAPVDTQTNLSLISQALTTDPDPTPNLTTPETKTNLDAAMASWTDPQNETAFPEPIPEFETIPEPWSDNYVPDDVLQAHHKRGAQEEVKQQSLLDTIRSSPQKVMNYFRGTPKKGDYEALDEQFDRFETPAAAPAPTSRPGTTGTGTLYFETNPTPTLITENLKRLQQTEQQDTSIFAPIADNRFKVSKHAKAVIEPDNIALDDNEQLAWSFFVSQHAPDVVDRMNLPAINTWVAFNVPDTHRKGGEYIKSAGLKILRQRLEGHKRKNAVGSARLTGDQIYQENITSKTGRKTSSKAGLSVANQQKRGFGSTSSRF